LLTLTRDQKNQLKQFKIKCRCHETGLVLFFSQFHEHFMSAFFVRKQIVQLFSNYSWFCDFLAKGYRRKKNVMHKMLIKLTPCLVLRWHGFEWMTSAVVKKATDTNGMGSNSSTFYSRIFCQYPFAKKSQCWWHRLMPSISSPSNARVFRMNFLPKQKRNEKKLPKRRSYKKFVHKNVDEIDTWTARSNMRRSNGKGLRRNWCCMA